MTKEAILYEKLPNDKVKCTACARYCEIGKNQIGLCAIRGNDDGKLQLYAYGKVISGHVDPIEKKPVIHYWPGSKIYSIATTGCNWLCKYCQNSDISQRRKIEGIDMTPEDVANTAVKYGAHGIAYTYNEPSIFIEFARDCGVAARKKGLFNAFVSNGYDTLPDVGDSLEYAKKLSKFVYDEFGPDMPIHFLRFHPDYKMMEYPSTPVKTLENHYEVAKSQGLKYVYLGNVPGHKWEHTYCSACNKIVVKRYGFDIQEWHLDDNNMCEYCSNPIPITGKLQKGYKQNRFQFVH